MDQRMYDAAQQGVLSSLNGSNHEANLQRFLSGLRGEPEWTDEQVDEIEAKIYNLLGLIKRDSWETERQFRRRAGFRD